MRHHFGQIHIQFELKNDVKHPKTTPKIKTQRTSKKPNLQKNPLLYSKTNQKQLVRPLDDWYRWLAHMDPVLRLMDFFLFFSCPPSFRRLIPVVRPQGFGSKVMGPDWFCPVWGHAAQIRPGPAGTCLVTSA